MIAHAAGLGPSSPRWRLTLEGAFWLVRPHIVFSKVPMAAAAWVIGRSGAPTRWTDAALLIAVLASMQALMFAVNDIGDAEADRASAPFLPIPSGMISKMTAMAEALLLGAVFLGCATALADSFVFTIAVLASVPAALGTMVLYGRTKAYWFSPFLASVASSSFAAWAWILAGCGNVAAFALLFGIASLHGIHANLRAQLRDIEGDPKAGTVTLAARIGPKRTLTWAAIIRATELAGLGVLALQFGVARGVVWLLPPIILLVVALTKVAEFSERTRDRHAQTEELFIWVYMSFLTELATLGVFKPMAALVLGAFMFTWFRLVRAAYYRRLVHAHVPI